MIIKFTTFRRGKDPVVRVRHSRGGCTMREKLLWDMFLTVGNGPWHLGRTWADQIGE